LEQQPKRQQVTKARIFGDDDQIEFARLTGDFNPIHLDPVAARRTLAGAPVVHGIHSLLWLLDVIAPDFLSKTIASLQVKFIRMLYVGETATAAISRGSETSLWLKIRVGGTDTLHATVVFGERLRKPLFSEPSLEAALAPTRPNELRLNEMEGQSGTLAFAHPRTELAHTFPRASQWIGEQRIAAIGCTTRLVGMVLPGLHSLYNNLNVTMIEGGEADNALAFRSEHVDPRFRLVRVAVSGGGISGSLEAFNRPLPFAQARTEDVRALVQQDEFAGSTALVVGGSRGLGELTAKIIAAGGGKVILTYAVGREDADAVAAEINECGGCCRSVAFDVRKAPASQLQALPASPTHIYYFATPPIFRQRMEVFSTDRFEEFNSFYVKGFMRLVEFGAQHWGSCATFFYPSSTAIDQRPMNMTEYTMSKAAGEILCHDINQQIRNVCIIVRRLPRLPTDQTASLRQKDAADPIAVMLPLVREVQATVVGR
jgi:acyl dehydratase/NADP-dependent 3-hydroxy acid dehydrogenase YdfG